MLIPTSKGPALHGQHLANITTSFSHVIIGCSVLYDPMYNSPLILSVTVTLNWYRCPPCSPDTTPEVTVSGNVTVPLTTPIVV